MTAWDFEWNIQPQDCPHCRAKKPAKIVEKKQSILVGGNDRCPEKHTIVLPSAEVVVCKECGREFFNELVDNLTLRRAWAIYQLITGIDPIYKPKVEPGTKIKSVMVQYTVYGETRIAELRPETESPEGAKEKAMGEPVVFNHNLYDDVEIPLGQGIVTMQGVDKGGVCYYVETKAGGASWWPEDKVKAATAEAAG